MCHLFLEASRGKKWTITYPKVPSAVRPVPHGEALPIHETPYEFTIDSDDEDEGQLTSSFPEPRACTDRPYISHGESSAPHILTQDELNDLVRDLELYKNKAEFLASRLQQWNLLQENVRITSFRNRHQKLEPFFRKEDNLEFCCDVDGLMNALEIKHGSQEWRLFIDSSKLSLKAVLLHNGNQLPSIPAGHVVHMKETYENLKQLVSKFEYNKYDWHFCGDLKVVSLLTGLQLGCTKYCCL